MSVIHVCYSVSKQTAAYRLHKGILNNNYKSRILLSKGSPIVVDLGAPRSVVDIFRSYFDLALEIVTKKILLSPCGVYFSLNLGGLFLRSRAAKILRKRSQDIKHYHWVGNGMLPLKDLFQENSQYVITLHDTWFFTGGCHVIGACEGYKSGCNDCPLFLTKLQKKIIRLDFAIKKKNVEKMMPVVVVPSSWMYRKAKESSMFTASKINVIPNGIETSVFKPLCKETAKQIFNINNNRKVILFGGISPTSDVNKGWDILLACLEKISAGNTEINLLVVGVERFPELKMKGINIISLGFLADEQSLVCAYNAADLTVVPSRQESFSQMAMESISCGVPVVAFSGSGPDDIIDHKINGYLASPYDESDFYCGIKWILNNKDYASISRVAREKAIRDFSINKIAQRHVELYESL